MLCCISMLYFPREHLLHAYQPVCQAFTHLNIIPQSSGAMFELPVAALNLVLNTITMYSLDSSGGQKSETKVWAGVGDGFFWGF